jgi:biopolymer transport protein ExbD
MMAVEPRCNAGDQALPPAVRDPSGAKVQFDAVSQDSAGPPGAAPPIAGRAVPPAAPPRRELSVDEPPPPLAAARHRELDIEMDMTPMVDITFLLLIFFMVTAAFSMQKSLAIPKPAEEGPSRTQDVTEEPADFVRVRVDENNTYQIIAADWEEEAPSEQDLFVLLRRAREGSSGIVPSTLRVEAHGDSLHEKVVAAIDAGTATGFEEVQLTTVEDE